MGHYITNRNRSRIKFNIPNPLKTEHEELHSMLKQATYLSGKTGGAAKTVAKLMHPHFIKQEEYALPPLGLLPQLASGNFSEELKLVLPLTDS